MLGVTSAQATVGRGPIKAAWNELWARRHAGAGGCTTAVPSTFARCRRAASNRADGFYQYASRATATRCCAASRGEHSYCATSFDDGAAARGQPVKIHRR